MGDDLLWDLEPATAAKHRLYKKYLDAWWPVLLQPTKQGYRRPRVTYVDAFAGPGLYSKGEEGSPIFALDRLLNHTAVDRMELSRDRVRLIFIEKRRDRYEHLNDELVRRLGSLEKLPITVNIYNDEAATGTENALRDTKAWGHPILTIFDSWGNVNVPLTLVQKVAHNKASEAITTFGPNWFSRRDQLNLDQLDAVFGGRQYWEPADRECRPDERWRVWLATYRQALLRAGFGYRLQFEVVPKTGLPLYLVFGTGHDKGVEVMKEAMWDVDGTDGMSFRDPRTRGAVALGQQTLWADDADPELIELVKQRLDQGPVSLEALGRWLLLETARWRARDARRAVQRLKNDGVATWEPVGALTKASLVTLR